MAGDRLYVGMMRANRPPGLTARAMAHAAHMLDVDFCYFNPTEVDLDNDRIKGRRYDKTGWRRCETALPDVVINDQSSAKWRRVWKGLSGRVPFTSPNIGDKLEIFNRMRLGNFYLDMQIPTIPVESFDDVQAFLELHDQIVVKPQNGSQGRNVFYFGRDGDNYRVNNGDSWERLDRPQAQAFFAQHAKSQNFIGQKFIDSVSASGIPFDVRLHVRRDRNGKWSVIRVYPRLGSGRSITSNVSAGGSVAPIRDFLKSQFGVEQGYEIRKKLRRLASEMPEHFQALYSDRMIEGLGIDIGLDSSGKPWLFEINAHPWSSYFSLDAAIARIGYAIYVAEKSPAATTAQPIWRSASGAG